MFAVDPESVIRRAVMNLASRFEVNHVHKESLSNGHYGYDASMLRLKSHSLVEQLARYLVAVTLVLGCVLVFTSSAASTLGDEMVWADAEPALLLSSTDPDAEFNSVSCVSAGNCTAVGYFKNAGGDQEAMTMTSTDGVWANVRPATFGDVVQYSSPDDEFESVSCVSAGHCTAVGNFKNAGGGYEAMTMTSTDGVWANALPATFGDVVQSSSPYAEFYSVSCVSAGNCTAAGYFENAGGDYEAMTMTGFRAQEDAPESSVPESSVPSLATLLALPRAMLLDTPEVMVGSTIEVTVGGFTAGDTVRLVVASTPQVLGSGLADASGSVTLSGVIPIDLAPGDHTIAAIDAEGRGFRQTVTAFAVSLPATGGSGSLSIGVMLIALGVAMTIAVRLRRERVS